MNTCIPRILSVFNVFCGRKRIRCVFCVFWCGYVFYAYSTCIQPGQPNTYSDSEYAKNTSRIHITEYRPQYLVNTQKWNSAHLERPKMEIFSPSEFGPVDMSEYAVNMSEYAVNISKYILGPCRWLPCVRRARDPGSSQQEESAKRAPSVRCAHGRLHARAGILIRTCMAYMLIQMLARIAMAAPLPPQNASVAAVRRRQDVTSASGSWGEW